MVHDLCTNVIWKAANADTSDTTLPHCVRDVAVALRLRRGRRLVKSDIRCCDARANRNADDTAQRGTLALASCPYLYQPWPVGYGHGERGRLLRGSVSQCRRVRDGGHGDSGNRRERSGSVHGRLTRIGIMLRRLHRPLRADGDAHRRRYRHARDDPMSVRACIPVVVLVLGASACAGAGNSVPPGAHTVAAKTRVPVGFTMHWPVRAVAQGKRRPAFVSPSTQSVVIEVNPDASTPGPITFANAPSIAGGTSNITIDAPAGNDVFVISLYDQPQVPTETVAAGNELGSVTVAQTIVANVTNTLSATVIGSVASVRIGPLPNQNNVLAVAASSPPAFELVGRAPATFIVAPFDVDGNVIVQPDAPPSISLAPNVRAVGILAVTPVSGAAGQYTVQAVAPNTTTYPTSLVATAFDANGGSATSSAIVDVTSAVYVSYANGGAPAVARFDPHGAQLPLPAGAFAGLKNPVSLAYDPDDREILVADSSLSKVVAFDESGAALASFTAPTIAGVNGVAYDPNDGNVYAAGSGGVTVFSPVGGAPKGGVSATFTAPNAQGVAYVASTPDVLLNRIAVGNTAMPALSFFSELGSGKGTAALSAAPIAIAYGAPLSLSQSPQTIAQLYVTSSTGVAAFDPSGTPVMSAADSGGASGITVDPNTREPQIAERSANAITTYLDDLSAVDPTRSFFTPSTLGLTQPQGVCDVF